jgi:hypothetical protein
MKFQEKTLRIIETARTVLAAHNPMTVRQVYYQLVSRQVVENNRNRYQSVSDAIVKARQQGMIPWEWIEDRLRRPREVSMWADLAEFSDVAARGYRRDVWATQPVYVEAWLEKDALSGIFEDTLEPYGVTLNIGRGFDGWSSIRNAAERYAERDEEGLDVTVLYFGDFDPSGEDMVRSLRDRLAYFDSRPEIIKCALTMKDIERYELPPDFAKKTDSRAAKFIAKHGDVSVELDALPADVLISRLVEEIEKRMDTVELELVRAEQELERERLIGAVTTVEG